MKKPAFTPLLQRTLQLLAEDKTVEQIGDRTGCSAKAVYKRLEKIHKHFGCQSTMACYRLAILSGKMKLK